MRSLTFAVLSVCAPLRAIRRVARRFPASLCLLPLAWFLAWTAPLQAQGLGVKFYPNEGYRLLVNPLVQAPDGNFYGVSSGIVQLTPEGVAKAVYTFPAVATDGTNAQGSAPIGGLLLGSDGNFYGLTSEGGALGLGTVYQFNPATGAVQPIASLTAAPVNFGAANVYPASLVQDRAGNFYYLSLTLTPTPTGTNETFAIRQVTPAGTVNNYHTFSVLPEGNSPSTGLAIDNQDNLYGFTNSGGQGGTGAFYEITPGGQTLALYSYNTNTAVVDMTPYPNNLSNSVVATSNGIVYGASPGVGEGGTGGVGGPPGVGTIAGGTIFAANNGQPTGLYTVSAGVSQDDGSYRNSDGVSPGGLTVGPDGNLYGETTAGGANGTGTVFEVTPGGGFTLLYTFPPNASAEVPPTLSTDGDIFGVSEGDLGAFYRLGATLLPTFNAPTITATATQGTPFTLQLVAANDPDTYAAIGLPAGLSLDAATGLITGATTAPLGTYPVALTATNPDGSSTATLTITVQASPDVPVLDLPKTPPAALINVPFSYQLAATNKPTFQIKGLPAGVTYDAKTGLIHGLFTHAGEIVLQIEAENASGKASGSLDIEVTRLPKATVAGDSPDADALTHQAGAFVITLSDASGVDLNIDYKVGGGAQPGVG